MRDSRELMKIQCVLYPGFGVGPFRYGDSLEMLLKSFDLKECEPAGDVITSSTWEVNNQEIRLYINETDPERKEKGSGALFPVFALSNE